MWSEALRNVQMQAELAALANGNDSVQTRPPHRLCGLLIEAATVLTHP